MYRNQGASYRMPGAMYVGRPSNPVRPASPRERPIHWGVYEIVSSAFFVTLSLMFVAGIAVLVLDIIGFNSMVQLYAFE